MNHKKALLYFLVGMFFTSCQITSKNAMDIKYNEKNSVTGTYEKAFYNRKEPSRHQGYYKIKVNDRLEINLFPPYDTRAIRPLSEAKRLEGRKVCVKGIIVEETFMEKPNLKKSIQSVNTPCFVSIESIELVEE